MTELEQWHSDVALYNDEYDVLAAKIREDSNTALKALRKNHPKSEAADAVTELSLDLQRLVEVRASAVYNFRGVKNFYERSLIQRKLEIMRNSGEKKIAANVAEGEAVIQSSDEFFLLNEVEKLYEVAEKRFSATETLIESLHLKLKYGYHS